MVPYRFPLIPSHVHRLAPPMDQLYRPPVQKPRPRVTLRCRAARHPTPALQSQMVPYLLVRTQKIPNRIPLCKAELSNPSQPYEGRTFLSGAGLQFWHHSTILFSLRPLKFGTIGNRDPNVRSFKHSSPTLGAICSIRSGRSRYLYCSRRSTETGGAVTKTGPIGSGAIRPARTSSCVGPCLGPLFGRQPAPNSSYLFICEPGSN